MTSHELARALLELPDTEAVLHDGCCDTYAVKSVAFFETPPDDSSIRVCLRTRKTWPIILLSP